MYSLTISSPLQYPGQTPARTTYLDLAPDMATCVVTTADPGGFATLDMQFQRGIFGAGAEFAALEAPHDIGAFHHVELRVGQRLLHAGRMMAIDFNDSGNISGFESVGYGIAAIADNFIESVEQSKKTGGTIVREVLQQYAPLLRLGPSFIDPGTLHSKSEYHALFPTDVINALIREGGAAFSGVVTNAGGAGGDVSNGSWVWLVYEDQIVQFYPRLPPANTPIDPVNYAINFDHRVQWHEDYRNLVGEVAVRYTNLDGNSVTTLSPRFTNPTFKRRYGFMRSAVLEGGKMRSASAEQYAQTYLANRAEPGYAVAIERAQQQGMSRPYGGVEIYPWLPRSGEWLTVGDKQPVPLIHTQYDFAGEVATYECGAPLPGGSNLMRTMTRVMGHVLRGTSAITGARV